MSLCDETSCVGVILNFINHLHVSSYAVHLVYNSNSAV